MSGEAARFHDLGTRVASAFVLAAVSVGAIWAGGIVLTIFVALVAAALGWEISRMLGAETPLVVAGLTGLAVFLASFVPWEMRAPLILAATGISYGMINRHKVLFVIAHLIAGAGSLSLLLLARADGLVWLVFLVGIVVVTDIGGYFAGRILGGPKFWPSLSPKKTWAGTVAGWVAAALFALAMSVPLGVSPGIVLAAVALSFASQMGDIFQSLVKRRAGVKDASALIPGHGGFWDRFDSMLAAALAYWPLNWVFWSL